MDRSVPPVSERVIENVAAATENDALSVPPLYETVDPDALETLIEAMADGEVSFTYAGQVVTVDSDGDIIVDGPSDSTPANRAAGDDD